MLQKLGAALNARLNEKFTPGKKVNYILAVDTPYLELDPRAFAPLKINEATRRTGRRRPLLPEALESTLPPAPTGPSQQRLDTRPILRHVYTKSPALAAGNVPNTPKRAMRALRSYSPYGEWRLLLTFGGYDIPSAHGASHFSTYSYDRHVPLAFFGSPFIPGTYHDRVAPVDLAVTLASLLRINQPSLATGHVLTQAIHPEPSPAAQPAK